MQSKWKDVINEAACDVCGAKKGDRCRSGKGYPTTIPHLQRRSVAGLTLAMPVWRKSQ